MDTVQFSPHSYTCRALLPDGHTVYKNSHDAKGKRPYLTVPCKRPHMQPIRDIAIDWQHYKVGNHLRNLEALTLMRSRMQPFIDALRYGKECRNFEDRHWNSTARNRAAANPYDLLADWNVLLIKRLAESFHIKCQWRRASQLFREYHCETNYYHSPAYLINGLIYFAKGTTYLSGPSWRSYIPNLKQILESHGIELIEVEKEK